MTNIGIVASGAPTTSIYDSTQNGSIFLFFYGADIWLMVSGFFISYLLLKQYAKLKSTKILLLKILRRFLRFWPLYMLSILINSKVLPLVGSGPLWPLLIEYPMERHCLALPHIFMVSNLFKTDCYNWLWLI
jgi:peptidoglycan/LPS O-acetylase OafA/YrhL